ncbi:MAG: YetF domain-containing protein [Balneolaceae bacterium]
MDYSWITTSWTAIVMVFISAFTIYVTLICFTRIAGLRSFSKMSGFDFAITVAVGSLVATTIISENPPLFQAIIALGILYVLRNFLAKLREISPLIRKLVDNQPTLLMKGPHLLDENLRKTKVTLDDLRAKLREANVTDLNQIKAVVLETTGDISVLHSKDSSQKVDDDILSNVKGWND